MANVQVTLRQKVTLNLLPAEKATYGLGETDSHIVNLPAGLVEMPEELTKHWMVANCIDAGRKPLMGRAGGINPPLAIEPDQVTTARDDKTNKTVADTILPAAELEALDDDKLRDYLRTAGNQAVAADAPREKVLARIEKLRPKAAE